MASDVTLALSMRIARHGGNTEVALAANVSLVWEYSGEMDGLNSTVALEAVSAQCFGPQAADKHSTRRAGPGRKALDSAQKPLRWKAAKCVNLPRKTGSIELAHQLVRVRTGCSVHCCDGVRREAGTVHADRASWWQYRGGLGCQRVSCLGIFRRDG
jgi:hypothetical protein